MAGTFITLEGIEGSGKSTQARRLAAHLHERGLPVAALREPGGTAVADEVRAILLRPESAGMAAETELLLYCAARADHVRNVIRPALEAGTHVVCDRFCDSTRAYQGGGRGLPLELVDGIESVARGGLLPHATLLLDLEVEQGLARARSRNAASDLRESRLDAESLAFHRRVRSAYLRLAKEEPRRIWVIDASGDPDDVAARVLKCLHRHLPDLLPD